MILDGWGLAPPGPGNAISLANLTHIPSLWANYPHAELSASGVSVGLPDGEDGNTETGHINIGAGRIVYQDLPRISQAIHEGIFSRNDAFLGAVQYACEYKSAIHLMGVLSDAGVHASRDHLYALLEFLKKSECHSPVYLHIFTDGRDAPPKSALRFIKDLESKCALLDMGTIATIMGRYFAMDRDRRWERTEKAYQALTEPIQNRATSAVKAIEQSYAKNISDEFIEPILIVDSNGNPYPRIQDHDAVIFFNFRIDRPRQLTRAFVQSDFESGTTVSAFDPYTVKYFHKHVLEEDTRQKPFVRSVVLPDIFFVTMTEYDKNLPCTVAFPPNRIAHPIGNVFAEKGLRQLRVAESEKERFVTYYFNGLRDTPYPKEDHLIIPSPKVATYDLVPAMLTAELTNQVLNKLSSGIYSFVVINIACPDMVAHTGNISSSIEACKTADEAVGIIARRVLELDGTCIVTGDHGNVEEMLGVDGSMDTEHSTFPVPFIMISNTLSQYPTKLPSGCLADIAPTILSHLHISIPNEMTGKNLLADITA